VAIGGWRGTRNDIDRETPLDALDTTDKGVVTHPVVELRSIGALRVLFEVRGSDLADDREHLRRGKRRPGERLGLRTADENRWFILHQSYRIAAP
jgi:hypothetical protein